MQQKQLHQTLMINVVKLYVLAFNLMNKGLNFI